MQSCIRRSNLKQTGSICPVTYFSALLILVFLYVGTSAATDAIDLSQAVVVAPKNLKSLYAKATDVLRDEIEKRTGISLKLVHQWPRKNVPVIAVSLDKQRSNFCGPYLKEIDAMQQPGAEGFRLLVRQKPAAAAIIVGADERGVLYGIGQLLRKLEMRKGLIRMHGELRISTTPASLLRGHQLGYRPKTNAYDAWTPAQYDQYIRDLAIFGANSIEIMPPRTDDAATSPHMKVPPMEMMVLVSRIIHSYGMDVWVWYPNMGKDYEHPEAIEKELQERERIFSQVPFIDAVFVPGGDPGDLHPNLLFAWLEKVAVVLNKYHPQAKIWVSPQIFRPTGDWLDAFYRNVNSKPSWFGGVVFGPWVSTPLPEIRKIVDAEIPIRRYPDITHTISCQYPVPKWDLAFAITLGRECINPRPVDEKHIHNVLQEYAIGSIAYSEGTNDDVNKFVWLDQEWDPDRPVIETLRDYGRYFIGPDFTEDVARGLMALEENWRGPVIANTGIDVTLRQWQDMERKATPDVLSNFRFQNGLIRAYYDAYQRRRLIYETELEQKAMDVLRRASEFGALTAIDKAEKILRKAQAEPVARDYWQKCQDLADSLYKSIGAQLTVTRHKAISLGRGAFVEAIDEPLNDARWLFYQFGTIRKMTDEGDRLAAIEKILHRTDPGPGGFYDNFGSANSWQRVAPGAGWPKDPGSLLSPRVSFGVGRLGQEWVHEVRAKGFEGIATPLAWMNQVTTLYATPLTITYDNLDPSSTYLLRIAYTGRFRSRLRLVADDEYLIHDFIQTDRKPIHEFDLPQQATQDGVLRLTWTCPEGQRGSQVAEIWLIKK